MKPILILFLFVIALASCRKNRPAKPAPEPAIKQVSFHVYAAKDYNLEATGSPWKWASGTVKLSIEKAIAGSQNQPIWDTTFVERPLVQFPLHAAKLEVVKDVMVLEPGEYLMVKHEVIYGVGGLGPQRFGRSYSLAAPQQQLQVNVEL